jgi:hypothetical protein
MIKSTKYFSKYIGELPDGCRLCVKGQKSVLFITGACPRHCFYCPISDHKKNRDCIYMNELPLTSEEDIGAAIEEAESHESKGAGITGGDPLCKAERVIFFIRKLKEHFGKTYHVHLYAPLENCSEGNLKLLFDSGLDEIRLHPDVFDSSLWERIKFARKFSWKVGIEIPIIPEKEKETIQLIEYFKDSIDFLNLNELEYSDTNSDEMQKRGYKTKDDVSYAIKGSYLSGIRILKHIDKKVYPKIPFNVHLCTAKLKDAVQLKNRMLLKARNAKLPVDFVSSDGMLIRGCIYHKGLSPRLLRSREIAENDTNIDELYEEFRPLFKKNVFIDKKKKRLVVNAKRLIKELESGKLPEGFDYAIVEEYPTYDALEVSVNFLN